MRIVIVQALTTGIHSKKTGAKMQYIIYYLLGGILFNLLYDLLVDKLNNQALRFTIGERIAVGLFWPIYLILFLRNFFIQLFKNNQDD